MILLNRLALLTQVVSLSCLCTILRAGVPIFYANIQIPGFVKNNGLVRTPEGEPLWSVQYFFSSKDFHLALTDEGFSVEWLNALPVPEVSSEDQPDREGGLVLAHRTDFLLRGLHRPLHWEPTGTAVAEVHCYQRTLPKGGFEHVPVFEELICREAYPGIDLVFRYDTSGLRYYFFVRPSGDASRIAFRVLGHERLFLTDSGHLVLYTAGGFLMQSAPLTFRLSDRKPVSSSFVLEAGQIRFRADQRALKGHAYVIDPTLIWSSLLGGTEDEFVGEAAGDNKFKTILSGHTPSTTFIATTGAYQTVYAGGEYDIFCAKFKTSGAMEWCTYFGGSKKDINYGVALDYSTSNNGIVLFGNSISDSMVTTPGAFQSMLAGKGDILITKFKSNGTLSWSTFMGGANQEHARQGVVDAKGDIYLTGTTKSTSNIATPGSAFPSYQGGDGDAYIAKFSKNGNRLWASYIGGNGDDRHHAICLDGAGNIYLHGSTESTTGLATAGTHQTTYGGNVDAFISRFDTSGNFYWNTYFGGVGEDRGRGIVADEAGNLYICGFTNSTSGIATGNAFQPSWTPGYNGFGDPLYDGYVAKFTPAGLLVWATYYGGEDNDILNAVDADQNEKVYSIGKTRSLANMATPGSFQPVLGGGQDGMILKVDTAGTLIWSTYVGGPLDDAFNGGRLGPDNMLYLAVDSDGNLPLTPGAHQTTAKGNSEAGAMKMDVQDSCLDVYEPNETLGTAFKLKPFSDPLLYGFSGSIASESDADWYSVAINPGHLKIELLSLTKNYDLKLYKKNGQLLFSSSNSGTDPETLIYNSAPKGTYYLEIVHSSSEFDPTDCYQLKVLTSTTPWREGLFASTTAEGNLSLMLWPVPASEGIHVRVTTAKNESVSVLLTDLAGRSLYHNQQWPSSNEVNLFIPTDDFLNGVYLIQCIQAGEVLTGRFVVSH